MFDETGHIPAGPLRGLGTMRDVRDDQVETMVAGFRLPGSDGEHSRRPLDAEERGAQRELGLTTAGLRLRGRISSRRKRPIGDGKVEMVVYRVGWLGGMLDVEDMVPPGGPYLRVGQFVDLEVAVRTYVAKSGQTYVSLRVFRPEGEF